jgi:hypothetical protein
MRLRSIVGAALVAGCLIPTSASADVGVESTSRSVAEPGQEITLTLGCGFCFPPCHGAPGDRHPLPCMLDTKKPPPKYFSILLKPAPGAHGLPPSTYLGKATPVSTQRKGQIPRYVLVFDVPSVPAGDYTYAIYCGVCRPGKGGSLITAPKDDAWSLRVKSPPSRGLATIAWLTRWWS